MSDKEIVTEITRMSMELEIKSGEPPEEAIRMALGQVLRALADAVERARYKSGMDFLMAFPMELSFVSENWHWNFHITGKLANRLHSAEQ